jgi:uncharacterized repeat protein (TIGR04076 family)
MSQQQNPTAPSKVKIELISVEGTCPNGHKVGDTWIINRKSPEPGICLAALFNLFNPIRILESGGSYPMNADPDSYQTCCPDIRNKLVFDVRRMKEKAID